MKMHNPFLMMGLVVLLLPSFAVANVTLYGQDFKGWDLSVSIYNLFDKEYGDVATSEHKQDLITQDAGTYRVKATYHF